jgi:hypothetical protein
MPMSWWSLLTPDPAGARVVEGGYRFTEPCPVCRCETVFREVELRPRFFGRLLGTGDLAFQCKDCEHVLDVGDRKRRRGGGVRER